ncbi:lactonase family protein [Roseimaritima ulvae]|nr:lactonase family protein [Roseimaritima ulvae]
MKSVSVGVLVEALLFGLCLSAFSGRLHAEDYHVYIGTYTGPQSRGIYVSRWDSDRGQLSPPVLAAEMKNPSFLAIHPNGQYLYAVEESADHQDQGQSSGALHAFRIERSTGSLTALNTVLAGGAASCHLTVDATGKYLLAANYTGGNVSVTAINKDGSLGQRTAFVQHAGSGAILPRQAAPHAHSINLDPQNRHAYVADLGLDKVLIYEFDADTGALTVNDPAAVALAPGAGPRHFSFHPNGKTAYVINEIDLTVAVLSHDAQSGALRVRQTLPTLPEDVERHRGLSTAEVVVHPSGKFVYGSNRGHDSIVVYQVDSSDGRLTYVENKSTAGRTPRNFAIDPSGQFLLAENQNSNSVVVFQIDPQSGKLTQTDTQIEVGSPVCIRFVAK